MNAPWQCDTCGEVIVTNADHEGAQAEAHEAHVRRAHAAPSDAEIHARAKALVEYPNHFLRPLRRTTADKEQV